MNPDDYGANSDADVMVKVAMAKISSNRSLLLEMLKDGNSIVVNAAERNMHTPFKEAFLSFQKREPLSPLWYSPIIKGREKEYETMLGEHGLTVEEVAALPQEWVMGILS